MLKLDKLVLEKQAVSEAQKTRKGLVKLAGALGVKAAGRDDLAIKIDIVRMTSKSFDPEGKSESYIEARFQVALESLTLQAQAKQDKEDGAVYYAGSQANSPREIFIRQTQAMANGQPADSVEIVNHRLAVTQDNGGRPRLKVIEETRKAEIG